MKQLLTRLTILVAGLLSPMLDELTAAEPIDIGGRLELFVDDYLIDRFGGKAALRLHRPTERGDVFTCDKPWEGNHSGFATFIQDGDTFRMYYKGANWRALGKATHDNFT